MAPKYNKNYYSLGTFYYNFSPAIRDQMDQAMNQIHPESEAGKVLSGLEGNAKLNLTNASSHVGTDNAGLEHINFRLSYTARPADPAKNQPARNECQTPEYHLYPDGHWTKFNWQTQQVTYTSPPYPDGKVKKAVQELPKADDFPSLGGKK